MINVSGIKPSASQSWHFLFRIFLSGNFVFYEIMRKILW